MVLKHRIANEQEFCCGWKLNTQTKHPERKAAVTQITTLYNNSKQKSNPEYKTFNQPSNLYELVLGSLSLITRHFLPQNTVAHVHVVPRKWTLSVQCMTQLS